jgi:hypothetical protein
MIEFSLRNVIVVILIILGVSIILIFILSYLNPRFGEFFKGLCELILGPFSYLCSAFFYI